MTISMNLAPSELSKTVILNTESFYLTDAEWEALNYDQQAKLLDKFAEDLPEQPYWYMTNFRKTI